MNTINRSIMIPIISLVDIELEGVTEGVFFGGGGMYGVGSGVGTGSGVGVGSVTKGLIFKGPGGSEVQVQDPV